MRPMTKTDQVDGNQKLKQTAKTMFPIYSHIFQPEGWSSNPIIPISFHIIPY